MIEVAAIIEKKDITVLGALKDHSNDVPTTIGGNTFSVGRVVFRGFAGGLHLDDRMYHGVVKFEPCERSRFSVADFTPIMRAMETMESEVGDGLNGDDHGND